MLEIQSVEKLLGTSLLSIVLELHFSFCNREQNNEQIESLWQTNITALSIPLGPKTPVSLLWSHATGFPDIPRFLEMDVTSIRNKPLQEIKTR